MRKKLDTRFPAARIKKIMQADEDVGKIAMAVPLLVSKALELFLQDLCDRTYDITLKRGAKTLNSLHLKQCVQTFNVFDFLSEIVSKVPDLGGSDAAGDDRSAAKRRKMVDDGENDTDDESKRSRMNDTGHTGSAGRGKGRGRGRGRGRGGRASEGDATVQNEKFEVDGDVPQQDNLNQDLEGTENGDHLNESKDSIPTPRSAEPPVRNFDLNVDLDENGDSKSILASGPTSISAAPDAGFKHEEYPGWSLSEVEKMAIDPIQLANLNRGMDEDDEDYDEEG
ncbi:dr1-associated corepressor [Eucalyptus grandis]|uniref:dr1-associated corepressor n=1 Tax=Eucalyptus grandis TaxID=71139 RepID=UPI00192EFD24|nr:dr1-associated corepressor [Eucalyptus grandis]